MAQIEKIARETPGVAHTITISGMSFVLSANSSNFGSMFVVLDPFESADEPGPARHGDHGQAAPASGPGRSRTPRSRSSGRRRSRASASPAASSSWSRTAAASGSTALQTPDRRPDPEAASPARPDRRLHAVPLQHAAALHGHRPDQGRLAGRARSTTSTRRSRSTWARSTSTASTSSAATGRSPSRPRARFRTRVEDINLLQVRNKWGQMVPLGTLVDVREIGGPVFVTRYNLSTAAPITGNVQPGDSSGDAIAAIDEPGRPDPAALDEDGMDRADVHADPGRQHRDVRLRAWRSCASSWPWRPSTRAGRCRWR